MHRPPAFTRLRRLRGVAGLIALGLLCRALIPAGFMPAAIGAGGPVVVCHGGIAGEFFRRLEASRAGEAAASEVVAGHGGDAGHVGHAAHGAHAGDGSPVGHAGTSDAHTPDANAPGGPVPTADHEGWEHCPFGAAFGTTLLAADAAPEFPAAAQVFEFSEPSQPVPFRPVSSYRARAPPGAAIHS